MPEIILSKVSGVTFENEDETDRQKLIKKFINDGDELLLEREPNNPHGSNAVAVYGFRDVDLDDNETESMFQIGYLNSKQAAVIAPIMDEGRIVLCRVKNKTGGGSDSFGVNIEMQVLSREETAERKRQAAIREADRKAKAQAITTHPVSAPAPKRKSLMLWVFIFVLLAVGAFWSAFTGPSANASSAEMIILGASFLVVAGILYFLDRNLYKKPAR